MLQISDILRLRAFPDRRLPDIIRTLRGEGILETFLKGPEIDMLSLDIVELSSRLGAPILKTVAEHKDLISLFSIYEFAAHNYPSGEVNVEEIRTYLTTFDIRRLETLAGVTLYLVHDVAKAIAHMVIRGEDLCVTLKFLTNTARNNRHEVTRTILDTIASSNNQRLIAQVKTIIDENLCDDVRASSVSAFVVRLRSREFYDWIFDLYGWSPMLAVNLVQAAEKTHDREIIDAALQYLDERGLINEEVIASLPGSLSIVSYALNTNNIDWKALMSGKYIHVILNEQV